MMRSRTAIKLLAIFSILFINDAFTQHIEWQNSIGGSLDDKPNAITQTLDGGYIIGGSSRSNISGDKTENCLGGDDFWIVKTDINSNIQWQITIGGSENDLLYSIIQTTDGGYICAGASESDSSMFKTENNIGKYDFWIVKLNMNGTIMWENTIGGSEMDYCTSIIQTSDGGYLCGGFSDSDISGDKTADSKGAYDFWLVKLNPNGALQWQKTIGGNDSDCLTAIQQTTDGGYICGGYSASNISGDKSEACAGNFDYWIVKINQFGNILWENTIIGNAWDQLQSIEQTSDGGYICGGFSNSTNVFDKSEVSMGTYDIWILKLDALGNIVWQNTIGGSSSDVLQSKIQIDSDNGYIIGASSLSNISGDKTENSHGDSDMWIIKVDSIGNIMWQNTIGGDSLDILRSIKITNDGGTICIAESESSMSGDKSENSQGLFDFWIIKLCNSSTSTMNVSACNFYISPSGNYIWNTSGSFSDTIPNSAGCDSVININLTILPLPSISISAQGNTTFCQGDSVMLSSTPGLLNYQWYRRNFLIPGATSINYTAKSGGRYSCIGQNATLCSDTSNFIVVNVPCIPIGPNQERIISNSELGIPIFQISPNPGRGIFTLQTPPGQIKVFNSAGQMILSLEIFDELSSFDISEYSDGIYFVMHRTGETIHSQKIILAR